MNPLKVLIWTNMPNHYQAGFHAALREAGVDVRVCYYQTVPTARVEMGWHQPEMLRPGERFIAPGMNALNDVPDWKSRLHVVPGYGNGFLRQLVAHLSRHRCEWVHWSEPSHPGLRRMVSQPVKRWYAHYVNRYALGAFANGKLAAADFRTWGIRSDRISLLTYSTPALNADGLDEQCTAFCNGRHAFIFVGGLTLRKGIDVLLQAFTQLKNDWVLLIVGPNAKTYERMADELGISDRVLFRGAVPANSVGEVLKASDVFVLPSRFDGWGVALNEAAASGKALIATDQCGAAHHLIEPNVNGFRIRAGDVQSLASAMQTYIDAPELAALHGQHSRQLAEEFGPQRNAGRFLDAVSNWRSRKS